MQKNLLEHTYNVCTCTSFGAACLETQIYFFQFIHPNKVYLPPIHQFPSFSISGHMTCHVIIIKRKGTKKPQAQDLLLVACER